MSMFSAASQSPTTAGDARQLLANMGAPHRLLRHVDLVAEAGEALLAQLASLGVGVDATFVRMGIVLHDAGKIVHPRELTEPGAEHESDGQSALLSRGVSPELARVCLSHARWAQIECSLEELLIALSDKLWKGVRRADLEGQVIARIASQLGVNRWSVFASLDGCFEKIALGGDARLQRSLVG